jgi:hypothetical protein
VQAVRVSTATSTFTVVHNIIMYLSSIYQDIPLYSMEEFLDRAPEELRTEDVLNNEHSLMLNRLSFELQERQRSVSLILLPKYILRSVV